jgi:hypothetical protein
MEIIIVSAVRLNFMKISLFIKASENYNSKKLLSKVEYVLVHTSQ